MNPVLILTHNCLEQTKRAVQSVRNQDIPTRIFVFDNGSWDGTGDWLVEQRLDGMCHPENIGVSKAWNHGLSFIFENEVNHCLVINNDVQLPSWLYRELLAYDVPFVTGVAVDTMEFTDEPPAPCPLQPNPDFSCFLIRREAWDKVGPFDERMKLYASDCDFHVRAHRLGVPLWKANCPYFHASSSTLKLASPEERTQIEAQANADRVVFQSLYGTLPGTADYNKLFEG